MAGTRQILQRRQAAENINKITHTMETVSSVRYRRYYRMWLEGIDFYDALAQLAYLVITAQKSIEHPLMTENDLESRFPIPKQTHGVTQSHAVCR